MAKMIIKITIKIIDPVAYPRPRERSIKSDMVVPAVLVDRITIQYSTGL